MQWPISSISSGESRLDIAVAPDHVIRCGRHLFAAERQLGSGGALRVQSRTMAASEQMFFFGAPLAHVVQYEERLRARRWKRPGRHPAFPLAGVRLRT
ncbi:hypothetical protein GRI75_09745 [Altererythrobacter soli]|uniref:Uncharacterized protein n=1 Tax=Croceibacterium soli TaxID=1739690 RepID=A0A6I4UT31_9SPHN|nr:hypothetical protein [Croceibacterium soli]MXP41921.1 hypothetical protein [Croceibacterium soli]